MVPGQNEVIEVKNIGLCRKIEESELSNHIFSLKVFLRSWQPYLLRDAVQSSKALFNASCMHVNVPVRRSNTFKIHFSMQTFFFDF